MIGRCVEAAVTSGAAEVIVVDDGSSDASPSEAVLAGAVLVESEGRGFSAAVNTGSRRATGDALLILNSDCFLERDALVSMARALEDDRTLGICAAALVEPDRSPAKSLGPGLTLCLALLTALSMNPKAPDAPGRGVEETEFVPLACATIRRAAWDDVSAGSTSASSSTSRTRTSAVAFARRAGVSRSTGMQLLSMSVVARRRRGTSNGGSSSTSAAGPATSGSTTGSRGPFSPSSGRRQHSPGPPGGAFGCDPGRAAGPGHGSSLPGPASAAESKGGVTSNYAEAR